MASGCGDVPARVSRRSVAELTRSTRPLRCSMEEGIHEMP
jgi:hypothetical protein